MIIPFIYFLFPKKERPGFMPGLSFFVYLKSISFVFFLLKTPLDIVIIGSRNGVWL